MQTLRKKTSPCKYKNDPSRFLGEGVSFKAKLIGILEVNEARGDRMCQEALADLKMAIRAAGEHKQRIHINIAIDGLRLRDEKTSDCLYHHPVHKISFIAQDMSDSRAFGYIFGSPDTGHRFFGIKTDKAASQVVIAMRDLFQVVFELKKKEIEMAKQHIEQHQQKTAEELAKDITPGPKGEQAFRKMKAILEDSTKENGQVAPEKTAQQTSEVIADLLDLEFELNNIQQGIHQMERITPSDPFGPSAAKDDPFGDSFAPASSPSPPKPGGRPQQVVAILPPPPSAAARSSDPFNAPQTTRPAGRRAAARQPASEPQGASTSPAQQQPVEAEEEHWFDRETESLFEDEELKSLPTAPQPAAHALPTAGDKVSPQNVSPPKQPQSSNHMDVFMELDPLGTGRNKPYIDRKDFFQELKNPPKKVLKDLVTEAPNEATAPLFQANFDVTSPNNQTYRGFPSEGVIPSASHTASSSVHPVSTATMKPSKSEVEQFPKSNAFKTDPFEDENFVSISSITTNTSTIDPFNTDFADFTMFAGEIPGKIVTEELISEMKFQTFQDSEAVISRANFHGPLRVSLPPEKENADIPPVSGLTCLKNVASVAPNSSASLSRIRSRTSKFQKQMTVSDIIRLPSPKTHQALADLTRQKSFDICSGSTSTPRLTASPTPPITPLSAAVERLSPPRIVSEPRIVSSFPSKVASFPDSPDTDVSSSLQMPRAVDQKEIAPEPPPRPTTNLTLIKPPPLPPKRQQVSEIFKPPPRPPHIDDHSSYDYIDDYKASVMHGTEDANKLPKSIPIGSPQTSEFEGSISVPRPKREPYIVPTEYVPSFPTLPQPLKKFSPVGTENISLAAVTTIESFLQTSTRLTTCSTNDSQHKILQHPKASLDITLSQLTKTGLTDLAQTLGVSTDHLSRMTLQDFTSHLSKLTAFSQSVEENGEDVKSEVQNIKREKYLTLRESVDEEPMFKAEFENHFDNSQDNEKFEDVFQNTSFDKYAVFRELIEQECKNEISAPPENNKPTSLELKETAELTVPMENLEYTLQNQDRYAALRQICDNDDQVGAEVVTPIVQREEQANDEISVVSQSGDAESFETIVVREPTSIIESTIEEEDITAIESEDNKSPEKISMTKIQGVSTEKISSTGTKYEHQIIQTDNVDIITSDHETRKTSDENVVTSEEEPKSPVTGWAKFDMKPLRFERPRNETSHEEAVSPWSSDGKEMIKNPPVWQDEFSTKSEKSHRYKQRSSPWKEEDCEEFWDDMTQHPQHENGWSGGESFYDEMVHVKERRARRKKTSPWKDRKICKDVSPLERKKRSEEMQHWKGTWKRCKDHSMDEEEDEEEIEYNRGKPRHRGLSWDEERRRRRGSGDFDGDEYEYGPKQRPSPWRVDRDRRGSWDSGSWDEEDRCSQREYADRWSRNEDEEEYRRRCEPDNDSRYYGRSRKYSGGSEGDYGHHEYVSRRRHRNYRDRSRESPWEEDYSEHEREDSLRYRPKKRNWPVRPNSASETRRTVDKHSPGDYKPRQVSSGGKAEMSDKSFASEWRYRDKGARPRSRESYFNSDQEYELWPSHKPIGHEQRSQTLQIRRNRRYRRPHDYGYSQKSPFDDDFSLQSFEIPDINSKDTCQDMSDKSIKSSEELIHDATVTPTRDSPKTKTDSTVEGDTAIIPDTGRTSTGIELQQNEDVTKPNTTRTIGQRQSPFEDDFTLPETHNTSISKRYTSSASSEVSDYLKSPFEDAHFTGRIESVAEEPVCDSDSDMKNGKEIDDVFLPMDNIQEGLPKLRREDGIFLNNATTKNRSFDKSVPGSNEDSTKAEKQAHPLKTRLSQMRADSTSSLRKSESVNIFVRETDPFDDDFFSMNEASASATDNSTNKRRDRSKANNDTMKWTKTFDFFDFEEGQ